MLSCSFGFYNKIQCDFDQYCDRKFAVIWIQPLASGARFLVPGAILLTITSHWFNWCIYLDNPVALMADDILIVTQLKQLHVEYIGYAMHNMVAIISKISIRRWKSNYNLMNKRWYSIVGLVMPNNCIFNWN